MPAARVLRVTFESRRRRKVERSQAGGVDAEDDQMRSALGVHGIDLRGSIIRHADMFAGSAFCVGSPTM